MSSFPTVSDLAAAALDDVMHLWTGLGYYARARNLHRAAGIVVERHEGRVPEDFEALHALPGVGRSTAGAILALACSQRHPILDGNARRVIARYFGVEGHIGETETLKRLWELADSCTPDEDVADYTQAIMDLGSMVCTRSRPACGSCPLADDCLAHLTARQHLLPAPRPKRPRPHRETTALLLLDPANRVLLESRPSTGLWGGLASLPLFDSLDAAMHWCVAQLRTISAPSPLPKYEHAFTHYDLTIHPLVVRLAEPVDAPAGLRWYDYAHPDRIGLTKPTIDLMRTALADAGAAC